MKLIDILTPERIVPRLEATDKPGILRELVRRGFLASEQVDGLGPDEEDRVVSVLEHRERLGSTGIKDGLAIPHGKVAGLHRLVAALGVHPSGVDFAALDGEPSRVFIVLISPESSGGDHLKALARISRLFNGGALVRRILEHQDANAMFDEIAAEDART